MAQQQQQEQYARQQYAPAKAATHSGQLAGTTVQPSGASGQVADQIAPAQDDTEGNKEPKQAAGASQEQAAKQPVSYPGSGQVVGAANGLPGPHSYYAYQQGVAGESWGYPSTGGPAYPGVYNPYP